MNLLKLVKQHFPISISILVLFSCKSSSEINLEGAWRLDSVYDYYNGFAYTNKTPYPAEVHVYNPDSSFLRKGMGHQSKYVYEVKKNLLLLKDTTGVPGAKLTIIRIDSTQLALKKEKPAAFPGKNQEHFEIRFFTRISLDSVK
jgi:hypothetical protein